MRALMIAAALCAATGAARADASMDQFLRHDQFVDVKLSPDGKYIAASMMTTADSGVLVVLDRATLKPTGTMKLRGRTFVNSFYWANDERIVLTVAESQGSETNPASTRRDLRHQLGRHAAGTADRTARGQRRQAEPPQARLRGREHHRHARRR